MREIWKYQLPDSGCVTLNLPKFAEILTVQMQRRIACLWALVDPKAETEQRTFLVAGTGHPIKEDGRLEYINTIQMFGGDLIFHIFEVTKE